MKNEKTKLLYSLLDEQRLVRYIPKITRRDFVFPSDVKNVEAITYSVKNSSGGVNEVFAFIGYPDFPMPKGGFPAVVLVHGGGGEAYFEWVKDWTDRGYVAIAPDFDAQIATDTDHRKEPNEFGGPKGYGSIESVDSPQNSWTFFSVFSVVCAANILSGMENVNKNKLAISGISWGSFLSLIAVSADKRFKALSVIYGSGFISDSEWGRKEGIEKLTESQLVKYNKYLDPQSYIADISIPVLFAAGTDDFAFTVYNRKRTADTISAEKRFSYRLSFPHSHCDGFAAYEQIAFTDEILSGEKILADCESLSDEKFKFQAGRAEITSVKLIYTVEDITKNDTCKWNSVDLPVPSNDICECSIPCETKSYFLEIKDADGLVVSTDITVR